MSRPLKLACFASLSLLVLLTNGHRANGQNLVSARILSADGPVEIRRAPQSGAALKKINFKPHDDLKAGDRIVTGWQGRLVLGLSDGSMAVLGESTTVEVRDLSKSPRELFNVLRGKTRVYIEKLGGRPNPYRINTPTAVIAVRGTLFDVIVRSNETEVFVHEGQVAVSNALTPEAIVLLSAGQMTRVRREQTPATPSLFKPGRNDDSFRRVPVTRPVDDVADFMDANTVDQRLLNTRTPAAGVRRDANPSAPVRGRRP
jgi:hypothetical protein